MDKFFNDGYKLDEMDLPPHLIKAARERNKNAGQRAQIESLKEKSGIEFDSDDDEIKLPKTYAFKQYWHPVGENWATSAFMFPYRVTKTLVNPKGMSKDKYRRTLKAIDSDWEKTLKTTGSHPYKGETVDIKTELDKYNKQFEPKKWGDKSFGEKAVTVAKGVSNAVAIVNPTIKAVNAAFDIVEAVTDKSKKETLKPFTYGFLEGKKVSAVQLKDAKNNLEIQKRNYDSSVGTIFENNRKKRLDAATNDYERAKGNYVAGALNTAQKVIDKIDSATYGGTFVGGGGGSSKNYWSKRFPRFYRKRRTHNYINYKLGKNKHRKFKAKKYYRKYWARYPRKWQRRSNY